MLFRSLNRIGVEYVQANLLCSAMTLEELLATGLLGHHHQEQALVYQASQPLGGIDKGPGKLLVSA